MLPPCDTLAYSPSDTLTLFITTVATALIPIVAFSSSAGLCGSFNANVWKELSAAIAAYKEKGIEVRLYPVGKKVANELRHAGEPFVADFISFDERPTYEGAVALAARLMESFLAGEVDQVELLYHHFKSTATQVLTRKNYLPLALEGAEGGNAAAGTDYILEPSMEALRDLLALQEKLVTIDNIQKTVAEYYKIKVADLLSKRRSRSVARPRQMAMALAKELTNHSLPEIGSAALNLVSEFIDTILGTNWLQVGMDILAGIGNGIINGIGSVVSAAKTAASNILNSIKGFFGIHSPSTVMRDMVGGNMMQGWANGIRGGIHNTVGAMESASKQVYGAIGGQLPAYAMAGNPGAGGYNGLQIVLNDGTLVGKLSPAINRTLGGYTKMQGRYKVGV